METSWKPVSKIGLFFGVIAAITFWFHALTDKDKFLLLDYINLPFHEFGHLFFGIFGRTIGI
jgi:Zn-dependent oligopeptidase